MKKLISTCLAVLMTAATVFALTAPVYADDVCDYYQGDDKDLVCGKNKTSKDAENKVVSILNNVYLYIGVIAVVVIVIAGVFYMISQGDPGKTRRARDAILYAAIGLIVVFLAFAITNVVAGSVKAK